jgi:hypothetical protein
MESLRESLAADFLKRIEKELGRENTLRLLWAHVVGPRLAGNTQLKAIHGSTLIVSVPDRSWLNSLVPLEKLILDAVNRLGGERNYDCIEFLEEPRMLPTRKANRAEAGNRASRDPSGRGEEEPRKAQEYGSTPVEIRTETIADENLRRLFLESARKYFSKPLSSQFERNSHYAAQEDRRS